MDELEQILRMHGARFPEMRPIDGVKLIYQNEFGGGHLIRDEAGCLNYLRREYDSTEKNPQVPLYDEIGNGIVRVNLAAVGEEELEALGRAFIQSAAEHTGSLDCFLQKLKVLCAMAEEGVFSFGLGELRECIAACREQGFPAVSHSPEYRRAYHPAYRVVLRERWQQARTAENYQNALKTSVDKRCTPLAKG